MDSNEFRVAGKKMVDIIADYLDNIRDRPVLPSVQPFYINDVVPPEAPEDGEPWRDVFNDIEKVVMPGMTHWNSPHFHAYFPTSNSYPAICADMLSAALSCIGFTWIASPACTELEMKMMDWLAQMIGLPHHFLFSSGNNAETASTATGTGRGGGVIIGTASEATLVTLMAARNRTTSGWRNTRGSFDEDILNKLVCYCSEQAHSSAERAGLLGSVRTKLVPFDPQTNGLRGEALQDAIDRDRAAGLIPFYVVATLGTTSTCSYDHLEEIGKVCAREKLWLHVDAAYAGSALVCPEFRYLLQGIQYADSFNMNPHKWLMVNFDCSALWIKDVSYLVDAFNVDPVYLRHEMQGKVPDYRHWQIPLGRRFRSLKMWFVFRMFGTKGLQDHIRKHVSLAKEFEKLVKSDDRFEVTHPVTLGLVCFRLKGANEKNQKLVNDINASKKIHITPTVVNEKFIIRFAVCSTKTTSDDIVYAWNVFTEFTEKL